MNENGGQGPVREPDSTKTMFLILGALLILAGLWSAAGVIGGVWFERIFEPIEIVFRGAHDLGWRLGLILLGIAVVMWTRNPRFSAPAKGARLKRSRSQRVVAGVMGGLSDYLGVDVVFLRVGLVAFALLFGAWPTVFGYVIATFIVPEESKTASGSV